MGPSGFRVRGHRRPRLAVEAAVAAPLVALLAASFLDHPVLVVLACGSLAAGLWQVRRGRDRYLSELATERERARRDALTSLLNRRGAEEALAQEHARVARGGEAAGLLLLDFDRFHWINETYDMAGGDLVLRELSRRLVAELRASDVVGRWGGEELIVVAPYLEPAALGVFAEKVRRVVRDAPVDVGGKSVTVTCSVGASMLDGTVAPRVSLQRANRALKQAKERRDSVCVDTTYEGRRATWRETQVDALTGLLNYQALASFVLPRELERALQTGQPLALLVVDLDRLKDLNDRFGHATGDRVIAGAADAITATVGREDLVFRIGGDAFAVLLPLAPDDACARAAGVVRAISRRAFADEALVPTALAHVTASVGVAFVDGAAGADVAPTAQLLLSTAEDAVLEAKTHGDAVVAKPVTADADVKAIPRL